MVKHLIFKTWFVEVVYNLLMMMNLLMMKMRIWAVYECIIKIHFSKSFLLSDSFKERILVPRVIAFRIFLHLYRFWSLSNFWVVFWVCFAFIDIWKRREIVHESLIKNILFLIVIIDVELVLLNELVFRIFIFKQDHRIFFFKCLVWTFIHCICVFNKLCLNNLPVSI